MNSQQSLKRLNELAKVLFQPDCTPIEAIGLFEILKQEQVRALQESWDKQEPPSQIGRN